MIQAALLAFLLSFLLFHTQIHMTCALYSKPPMLLTFVISVRGYLTVPEHIINVW